MEVYTKHGWVLRENPELLIHETDICCDCDNPATVVTNAGLDMFWAQCADCALEFRLGGGYNPERDGIEAPDLNTVEIFDFNLAGPQTVEAHGREGIRRLLG
jgi:hypothetical protein